jgi:hypothetical protein
LNQKRDKILGLEQKFERQVLIVPRKK